MAHPPSDPRTSERLSGQVNIDVEQQAFNQIKGEIVLLKYGGNAMLKEELRQSVVKDVCILKKMGAIPVIVHGGGPYIKSLLEQADITSEFVEGHRKTDSESIKYVEMALKGQVNGMIVNLINAFGYKGVGISGKDGRMVEAVQRKHYIEEEDREVSLGHVGDVNNVNPSLVHTLIEGGYIPVIAPIGSGVDHKDYNINADMFAGHMAGALQAAKHVALTDVDGLMKDPDDPQTLIKRLSIKEARENKGGFIQGGMIPKVESCLIALEKGVSTAHIINGTKKHVILQALLTEKSAGTQLYKS